MAAKKKATKKSAKKTAAKTVRVVRLKGRGSSGRVTRPTRGLGMRVRKADSAGDCPPAEVVTKIVYRDRKTSKKKATKKTAAKKRKKTTTAAAAPRKGQKKVVAGYVWTCAGLVKRGCGGGATQIGSARRVSSKMTEINKRLKKLGIKGRVKG